MFVPKRNRHCGAVRQLDLVSSNLAGLTDVGSRVTYRVCGNIFSRANFSMDYFPQSSAVSASDGGKPELMTMNQVDTVLQGTATALEVAGVGVIVVGALFALVSSLVRLRKGESDAYYHFRRRLGRAILLGLELLVAADIVGTVAVEPTLENVLVLAFIVLIRTFLSVSLTVEIEGRWPWQGSEKEG